MANDHKKALQEVANDAEKSIHTFKRDALLAINECTENNAQLLVRDKLEIKSNREQMKIDLKKQFDDFVTQLQEETNEHIANLVELSESIQSTLSDLPSDNTKVQNVYSKLNSFQVQEQVTYKDTITGQEC